MNHELVSTHHCFSSDKIWGAIRAAKRKSPPKKFPSEVFSPSCHLRSWHFPIYLFFTLLRKPINFLSSRRALTTLATHQTCAQLRLIIKLKSRDASSFEKLRFRLIETDSLRLSAHGSVVKDMKSPLMSTLYLIGAKGISISIRTRKLCTVQFHLWGTKVLSTYCFTNRPHPFIALSISEQQHYSWLSVWGLTSICMRSTLKLFQPSSPREQRVSFYRSFWTEQSCQMQFNQSLELFIKVTNDLVTFPGEDNPLLWLFSAVVCTIVSSAALGYCYSWPNFSRRRQDVLESQNIPDTERLSLIYLPIQACSKVQPPTEVTKVTKSPEEANSSTQSPFEANNLRQSPVEANVSTQSHTIHDSFFQ